MNHKKAAYILFLSVWITLSLFGSQPASAQTVIIVNITTDSIMDDGHCSLREAVIAANTDSATGGCPAGSGADVIQFDSSLPIPATFLLTMNGANEDNSASGDLDLQGILTIQGSSAIQIIIDGNNTDRVFEVRPGATITLSNLTIRNGNPGSGANGGGILVTGGTPRSKITLINSLIMNNTATSGGGIQNLGNGANAVIENTLISSNTATVNGGGISNTGSFSILNSTLTQNTARSGGAVDHAGFSMNLTNTTISGNSASDNGGGIYNRADTILLNVTLFGNTANGIDTGGNIFNDTASLSIKNSIVTNSDIEGNCFNSEGIINSQGNNLESGDTCEFTNTGDKVNTDPLLGNLQDNFGSTFTHALLADSPAIDQGDNANCPKFDQRGFSRPADGDGNGEAVCDIGAFELGGIEPTSTATSQPVITPSSTFTPTETTDITSTPSASMTPVITPTPTPQIPPCSSASILLIALFLLMRPHYR